MSFCAISSSSMRFTLNQPSRTSPDCSATVTNSDGTTTLLNFEIAQYYVDDLPDVAGGSPSKRVYSCWEKVSAILYPRLETLRLPVDVRVWFKEPVSLRN